MSYESRDDYRERHDSVGSMSTCKLLSTFDINGINPYNDIFVQYRFIMHFTSNVVRFVIVTLVST